MRNLCRGTFFALVVVVSLSSVMLAQTAQAQTGAANAKPVDPHDLSGIWNISTKGNPPGTLNSISNDRPPMTPAGQAIFKNHHTGYDGKVLSNGGPEKDESKWTDPYYWCDPVGFPRVMWHPETPGLKIIQSPKEVVEFFENQHTWRDIWTDGRQLPKDPELRWYGYSIGKWNGDTFVVDSSGFDDRTWVDQYGSPHDAQMKIEERFQRVDRDHLEQTMTLEDPKIYTKPWVGRKEVFDLAPLSKRNSADNWGNKPDGTPYEDMREELCVWSEMDSYFHRINPGSSERKSGAGSTNYPGAPSR